LLLDEERVERELGAVVGIFAGSDEDAELEGDRGLLPVFVGSVGAALMIIFPFTILIDDPEEGVEEEEEEEEVEAVGRAEFEAFSLGLASLVMLGSEVVLWMAGALVGEPREGGEVSCCEDGGDVREEREEGTELYD